MKSMRPMCLWIASVTLLFANFLSAQDITGPWQGTLKDAGNLRIILKIEKSDHGGWNARLYSIDQGPEAMPTDTFTIQDSTIKFTINQIQGSYQGKLRADGTLITGTWSQGNPLPLDFERPTKEIAWRIDSSPHTAQFVPVEKDVKLEVLDWGGSGPPLVLLSGLGNTAHIFDKLAPKLTAAHHVYGITRRGFGDSSAPPFQPANYTSDRLGDDVLAVIDALKLNKPVLIGHSIAGEELSSVATRHPEKISGLIYLDAGYSYALYDQANGDITLDSIELRSKLKQLLPGEGQADPKVLTDNLLTQIRQFEKELEQHKADMRFLPPQPPGPPPPMPPAISAVIAGEQKYAGTKVPTLAIFADPHDNGPSPNDSPEARAAAEAVDLRTTEVQAKAFEVLPNTRVVRLPHANHYVFESNEADVLREINTFLTTLQANTNKTAPLPAAQ